VATLTRRGFFGTVAALAVGARVAPTVAAPSAPVLQLHNRLLTHGGPYVLYGGTAGGGKSLALTFHGHPLIWDEEWPTRAREALR
jgi:hypothetical protein